MTLRLRRHHILCSLAFDGQGYDDAFTANMARIVYCELRGEDGAATQVLITRDADAICAPCPSRRGLGCEQQPLREALDARHGAALGVEVGDRLTWGTCVERVKERVSPTDLATLCHGCRWLDSGMCATAIAQLTRDEKGPPKGDPK